jgi:hypothetical protein
VREPPNHIPCTFHWLTPIAFVENTRRERGRNRWAI